MHPWKPRCALKREKNLREEKPKQQAQPTRSENQKQWKTLLIRLLSGCLWGRRASRSPAESSAAARSWIPRGPASDDQASAGAGRKTRKTVPWARASPSAKRRGSERSQSSEKRLFPAATAAALTSLQPHRLAQCRHLPFAPARTGNDATLPEMAAGGRAGVVLTGREVVAVVSTGRFVAIKESGFRVTAVGVGAVLASPPLV